MRGALAAVTLAAALAGCHRENPGSHDLPPPASGGAPPVGTGGSPASGAAGVVVGAVTGVGLLAFGLRDRVQGFRSGVDWHDPALRQLGWLMLPILFSCKKIRVLDISFRL